MAERRRSERQRSLLKGRIEFNNGRSTLDCLVRDISEHGARLKISGTFVLPEIVELYVPSRKTRTKGRIAWRTFDEIGLKFELDDVLTPNETADDLAGRVRCVESQMAILEGNVAELRAILCTGQGSEKQERTPAAHN